MPKSSKVVGTTSLILQIFVPSSAATDGSGLAGLVFNTASLTAYYKRNTANADVAITLITATLGTYASGGFKEIDATNMPGWYELHLPNAALVTGADSVAIHLRGAANMVPVALEIELTAINNQDAVRFGLSALPNVAAGANGGLPTGNASGQVAVATLAAGAIQSIWDALTSALTTSGSVGKRIADFIDATISGIQTKLGSPAGGSVSADIATANAAIAAVPTLNQITAAVLPYCVTGTTTGTPSTTSVQGTGGALSSTDGTYVGGFLVITSGSLQAVAREITAYTGATKTFTTQPFPVAPASAVSLIVVGNVPN